MAFKKNNGKSKAQGNKSKSKYNAKQRKGYWVGVGIAAERFNESGKLINHHDSKIRSSVQKGYSDVNYRDVNNTAFGLPSQQVKIQRRDKIARLER